MSSGDTPVLKIIYHAAFDNEETLKMAKVPGYAAYLYQTCLKRKEQADAEIEGCDEILAYITVRTSEGVIVKITELVQSLMFGTGPTVHRKVLTLAKRGLIEIVANKNDARAKDIRVTAAGLERLKDQTKFLKRCLE